MRAHLMRHGIAADAEDPRYPTDAERPLTDLGRERLAWIARGLAAADVVPERVLVSPLLRARQTAEIVARELGLPAERLMESGALVYDRAPAELIKLLGGVRDMEVLCIGHAPLLDRVIARLVQSTGRPFTRLQMGGLATVHGFPPFQMPAELVHVLTPDMLGALGGDPKAKPG